MINSIENASTYINMGAALKLVRTSNHFTMPNPRVGCITKNNYGKTIGQGHTQSVGNPHAEIMALADAKAHGHSTQGATVYVTLEPCSHHGRTGPCCDALIAAGVSKVVAACEDPNPLVAGQGFARLRAAGIAVEVLPVDSPLAIESREINIGFFSRMIRKKPWVRMKLAASLDGATALKNGTSQWITTQKAREDGHAWRARACAILTGIGTVLADNPRLDIRGVSTSRQPCVVIVDGQLDTPPTAALFTAVRSVYIYAAQPHEAKHKALEKAGAIIIYLPEKDTTGTPTSKVDLHQLMLDLGRREINELHIEAGFRLNGAFAQAGLVDEFLIYLAPKFLGQGLGMLQLPAMEALEQQIALQFQSVEQIDADIRIVARIPGRAQF